ncbi:MAG TPA: TonB-dependent copper receptor [Gallionella sp.]|nr:TonB-dependent copper receptor [Gallionella sp.]
MKLKRITLCVALACAPAANAAEETLPEVVVTAPAMEQPLVVTTDPRKPRQPIPAHDGADYLKTIPGFNVIRKGGTDGDPVFRGMAGSRLNILLDGQTILGGCGGRMDPPTAYVFPSAYDKITVLKGPQTVLYGPGNSAGTVLFERSFKRADQAVTNVEGALTLGSFGRNDEMLEVRTGTTQAYARGTATRSDANDYRDGNGTAVHSAYRRWSANGVMGFTPNESTRVEFSVAQSDGKAAYADRSVDGSKFARDNVGLKMDWNNIGHALLARVEAQIFRNYIDHVMDTYSMRTGGTAPSNMMSTMNPDRTTTGGRVIGTMNVSDTTQLKLGLDAQTNVHTGRTGAAPGFMGAYDLKARVEDANFQNQGLFGEMTHAYAEESRVVGGLRVDWWRAQDKRATVDMMGMIANPTQNQTRSDTLTSGFVRYEKDVMGNAGTVYAGLGHTERFPDYWELISKETATTRSSFNTKPEKTSQLDAGMTYKAGAVSASLSGFYNKVRDYILVEQGCKNMMGMLTGLTNVCGAGLTLTSMTRNINATTWGGEATAAWQFAPQWKLDGALAYVRGTNDTDRTALAQLSPLEGRIGTTYDNGIWTVGSLVRLVAAQNRFVANQGNIVGTDISRTGGFGVLSLNGAYRINKNAQVSAGVDNLLDKTYAEHISRAGAMVAGFAQTTRVNETGRNLWVKANLKF